MNRRQFVSGIGCGVGLGLAEWCGGPMGSCVVEQASRQGPIRSVIPVVADGKWIWKDPPPDQMGYLEARAFELSIGVKLEGVGDATQIRASTPVPVEHAEQKIDSVRIEATGCQAKIQPAGEGAAQLLVAADGIARGQVITALAHYRLTLKKQYLGHERDHFPAQQTPPAAIRKQYLQDSPGIQTNSPEIRKLLAELRSESQGALHPWEQAQSFCDWVRTQIRPQIGAFTNVLTALKRRTGDCEEMAAVFVALCRAAGIPARLVWVPNHNWAEFYLTDRQEKGHWIPAHTACYPWFGWTGVHELVIQKGDRVTPSHQRQPQRLLEDWLQWSGKRPDSRYVADLKPLPPAESESNTDRDPGPGARSKQATGEWKLAGTHPLEKYLRSS